MKNKSVLVMFELLIMILVFLFVSAVCLKIFAASDGISCESAVRDEAVILAQNSAEILKATKGNISAIQEYISDNTPDDRYSVIISEADSDTAFLGKAVVTVNYENKEVISLTVCWQEVQDNE